MSSKSTSRSDIASRPSLEQSPRVLPGDMHMGLTDSSRLVQPQPTLPSTHMETRNTPRGAPMSVPGITCFLRALPYVLYFSANIIAYNYLRLCACLCGQIALYLPRFVHLAGHQARDQAGAGYTGHITFFTRPFALPVTVRGTRRLTKNNKNDPSASSWKFWLPALALVSACAQ